MIYYASQIDILTCLLFLGCFFLHVSNAHVGGKVPPLFFAVLVLIFVPLLYFLWAQLCAGYCH